MKPRMFLFLLTTLSVAAFAACTTMKGSTREHVEWEGLKRSYRVHVPPSYSATMPAPLVVMLHGACMNPMMTAYLTKFNDLADREGFLVAYPRGIDHRWNSGLDFPRFPNADDVGFVARVIAEIETDYAIDTNRVYVTGSSNGGLLAHMVACQLSQTIAAAAPVVAAWPVAAQCPPGEPVPIVMINSVDDPAIPWEGGALFKNNQGRILSVEDTVQFWVRRDNANPTPEETRLPRREGQGESRVLRTFYKGQTPSGDVVYYRIEEAGHTWPGGSKFQLQWFSGNVNRDFDATEVIWEFFKNHPKSR